MQRPFFDKPLFSSLFYSVVEMHGPHALLAEQNLNSPPERINNFLHLHFTDVSVQSSLRLRGTLADI